MTAPSSYTGGLYRPDPLFRGTLAIIGLLVLLVPAGASAQHIPTPIIQTTTNESIAFARYIAWLYARDPFTESGPVALAITASVPGLNKQGRLLAIRDVGESERSEYAITEQQGDSIVLARVIVPYLIAQRQAEDLPLSSVLITPRNYKFRYVGLVDTGDSAACIFRITPKKRRAGADSRRIVDRLSDRCASSRDRTVREDPFHLHKPHQRRARNSLRPRNNLRGRTSVRSHYAYEHTNSARGTS
jgi:hypothetical protein